MAGRRLTYPYLCECSRKSCRERLSLAPETYEDAARAGAVLTYWCALADRRAIIRRVSEGVVVCRTGNGGRPRWR